MKNKQVIDSWDKIKTDEAAHERILNSVLGRIHAESAEKGEASIMKINNKQWKRLAAAAACLVIVITVISLSNPFASVRAEDLMKGVNAGTVEGRPPDALFEKAMAEFSIELFKKSVKENENSLISPLSVLLALAMTANGTGGETLAQMEKVLGGDIPLAELNEYLHSYVQGLSDELKTANSIWFRDDKGRLEVKKDFLQKNADYYGAAAYASPFDAQTVKDVNNWVKDNTGKLIDSILEQIDPNDVMYLINAVVFDAKWETVYEKKDVRKDYFEGAKGKQKVDFMFSDESRYLDDGRATGFIKPYEGGKYSFAAILPNEGISVGEYISSLTGAGFAELLANVEYTSVNAAMPKFEYDYEFQMNDALIALGMPDAFDSGAADFKNMAVSSMGNIFIGEVLHKTFITVDEAGTKAGAITKVEMVDECASPEGYTVKLDRPFVYAIIDSATNLPVFIGTVEFI